MLKVAKPICWMLLTRFGGRTPANWLMRAWYASSMSPRADCGDQGAISARLDESKAPPNCETHACNIAIAVDTDLLPLEVRGL